MSVVQIRLPPTIASIHHWGMALVQFGKYKNKPYREVMQDHDYIKWLIVRKKHVKPEMKDLQEYVKARRAVEAQQ